MKTIPRIAVKEIELDRAEGPTHLCGKVIVSDFASANLRLATWALTAPKSGKGYNKIDFKVTWEDGETYEGRYDLNQEVEDDEKGQDLARHIRHHLYFICHKPQCEYFKDDYSALLKEASEAADWIDTRGLGRYDHTQKFWCCKDEEAR